MRMLSSFPCGAVLVCVVLGACDRDTPAGPTAGLDGTWRGTITRGTAAGTITLQMTQSGAGVTGVWTADLDGIAFDQSGSTGGTVVGSTVSLFLNPTTPTTCASGAALSGTLSMNGSLAGDRLTGDYVVFACDSAVTGRIEVTRR